MSQTEKALAADIVRLRKSEADGVTAIKWPIGDLIDANVAHLELEQHRRQSAAEQTPEVGE